MKKNCSLIVDEIYQFNSNSTEPQEKELIYSEYSKKSFSRSDKRYLWKIGKRQLIKEINQKKAGHTDPTQISDNIIKLHPMNSALSFPHFISISSVSPLPSPTTLSPRCCNSIPSQGNSLFLFLLSESGVLSVDFIFRDTRFKGFAFFLKTLHRLQYLNDLFAGWIMKIQIWRQNQVKAFTHFIVAKPYIWFGASSNVLYF